MDEPAHVRENMRICDFLLLANISPSVQSRHSLDNQPDTSGNQSSCPDDDDSAGEKISYNILMTLILMHAKIPEIALLWDNKPYFTRLFSDLFQNSELIPAWYDALKNDDSQGFSFTNQQFQSLPQIYERYCMLQVSKPKQKRSNSRN